MEHALTNLPPTRNPSPTRILAVAAGARIGDSPGEVSAAQVRRETKQGPKVTSYDGYARLLDTDGNVLAKKVLVSITNRPDLRPDGVRSKFFGALRVLPADGEVSALGPVATLTGACFGRAWAELIILDPPSETLWRRVVERGLEDPPMR